MRVGMKRYDPKVINAPAVPLSCAISRFWGFPIGLITLPVMIANASVIKNKTGEILNRVASARTRGGSDNSQGIIHQECRQQPHSKQYNKYQLFGIFGMGKNICAIYLKYPISTSDTPTTNIPNKKKDHIGIDRL